jgi:RimJ/RimL family protein N-acetyltransferase
METRPVDGPDDLRLVHGWLADPDNAKWLDFGNIESPSPAFVAALVRKRPDVYWLFTSDEGSQPVGLVALTQVNLRFGTGMPWMVLGNKRYARARLTTRALDALIRYGFDELGLTSLHAWAAAENAGCIKIAETLGFRAAGRQRQCHVVEGRRLDRLLYDLLRSEYVPLDGAEPHARATPWSDPSARSAGCQCF